MGQRRRIGAAEMIMGTEFRMGLGLMTMFLFMRMPLFMARRFVQQGGVDLRFLQSAMGLGRKAE